MHACIFVGVDSSFRWNDGGVIDASLATFLFIIIAACHGQALNNRGSYYRHFVIPAKAGILWVYHNIPVPAGMTT